MFFGFSAKNQQNLKKNQQKPTKTNKNQKNLKKNQQTNKPTKSRLCDLGQNLKKINEFLKKPTVFLMIFGFSAKKPKKH